MCRFRPIAEVVAMTTTSCCGRTPRGITIGLSDTDLSFLYCERCESRQWFRGGVAVTLAAVKDAATAEWNKSAAV
jgi:hypothetical protein